jgi:hypothetical protein
MGIIMLKALPRTIGKALPIALAFWMAGCSRATPPPSLPPQPELEAFQADLKQRTFNFFWEIVDTVTYQTDDRWPTQHFVSIAATGFALPAYIIGAENGYITRDQAARRTFSVLNWMWNSRQSADSAGATGYKGFYYHFLNYGSGTRFKDVELSTIDTGLLMAGVLTSQAYFDTEQPLEKQIRDLADSLYLRIDWNWAMNGNKTMSMGWRPERGFIDSQWKGYNEAMILLVLGMGSPTHPLPADAWSAWTSTYEWHSFYGFEHVGFGPLFGHQYSHMFIDFKGIQDAYMKERGIDYFENSRRATLANRAYCIDNPGSFAGYSPDMWGLTACDGPGGKPLLKNGKTYTFKTYHARGAAQGYFEDDGTISPTAAGGSIPFAPDEALAALYMMKKVHGEKVYQQYGFVDAFNMTRAENGWFDHDYLGIDQGPILIQLENYQTGLIWNTLKKNKYIVRGLTRAGFSGGWLVENGENG